MQKQPLLAWLQLLSLDMKGVFFMVDRSLNSFSRAEGIFEGSKYSKRNKAWANWILQAGIKELKNEGRSRRARFSEVVYYIGILIEAGFWWQAARLRNQLYRHWRHLQPKADPRGSEELSS